MLLEAQGHVDWQGSAETQEPQAEPSLLQAAERFVERYPVDERASHMLMSLAPELLTKVIETFDPRNKEEVDYSRQVMGFVRSLRTQGEALAARKRALEDEEGDAGKRLRASADAAAPSEAEIMAFRDRYPMDERAYEYLVSSPAAAQVKVLSEFKPRVEGEPDYSSLITSLVKKARNAVNVGFLQSRTLSTMSAAHQQTHRGPSLAQLREFRERFPMDERAWGCLLNASGAAQEVIIKDFKPRRFDDADYSAAVTAFARSMTNRGRNEVDLPPCPAKQELFRERFPMDDRAFQYLVSCSAEVQKEAMEKFSPKNMEETDYSRQLTFFLNSLSKGFRQSEPQGFAAGYAEERRRRIDWRSVPDVREVGHRQGGYGGGSQARGGGGGRLHQFRAQYPMDDRAFDYLQQADPEVQELVLAEFQPKRRHIDGDYSASVTSYVKAVKAKILTSAAGNGAPATTAATPVAAPAERAENRGGLSSGELALLEGFRRRYPMDDRAFEFLCGAEPAVKQKVIESFRPKYEGEGDYSGLITSFIRACWKR